MKAEIVIPRDRRSSSKQSEVQAINPAAKRFCTRVRNLWSPRHIA
jgi:hypothetical protein